MIVTLFAFMLFISAVVAFLEPREHKIRVVCHGISTWSPMLEKMMSCNRHDLMYEQNKLYLGQSIPSGCYQWAGWLACLLMLPVFHNAWLEWWPVDPVFACFPFAMCAERMWTLVNGKTQRQTWYLTLQNAVALLEVQKMIETLEKLPQDAQHQDERFAMAAAISSINPDDLLTLAGNVAAWKSYENLPL